MTWNTEPLKYIGDRFYHIRIPDGQGGQYSTIGYLRGLLGPDWQEENQRIIEWNEHKTGPKPKMTWIPTLMLPDIAQDKPLSAWTITGWKELFIEPVDG
jgi:hypothetical protein